MAEREAPERVPDTISDAEYEWLLRENESPPPRPLPPDPLGPDEWRYEPDADRQDVTDDADVDDYAVRPGPVRLGADALADAAPGADLAALLEAIDPRRVDEYELVEMIAASYRISSWAMSLMTRLTGHLARRPALNPQSPLPGTPQTLDVAADEIAPRLGITRFAARRTVQAAELFRDTLEDTGAALREGRIDYAKALVLVQALHDQPPDVAWDVQQQVLPDAPLQTVRQLERAVSKAIIAVDPHRAAARHRKAREERRVGHPRVLPDGMASMFAVLPATDAAGLDLALEATARSARAAGDPRTLEQLRADALALLGHSALERGYIGCPDAAPDRGPVVAGGVAVDHPVAVAAADAPAAGAPSDSRPAGGGPADDAPADGAPARGGPADGAPDEAPTDTAPTDTGPTDTGPDGGAPHDDATAAASPDSAPDGHGSFPWREHMPIGTVGGRQAQIQVTVPLSVLLPPEVLSAGGPAPDWSVRLQGDSSARGPSRPCPGNRPPGADVSESLDDRPADTGDGVPEDRPPGADVPAGPGDCPDDHPDDVDDDLPEGWYPGPVPSEVAELHGYGPITPDVAQALAYAGGTWQRLVTDPLSGVLLDVGRTRYRPPAAIADFVRLRDGTCVSPGCATPAQRCEIDHVKAWCEGGTTSTGTLACLCKGDHVVKTSGAFEIHHEGDGSFVWTTPSGHRYRRDHTGRITLLPPASAVEAVQRELATRFGDGPPF